jgi:HAD superfamily hydrolase (TIGR01509 family)
MGIVRALGFDLDHTLAIDNRLERVAFLRLLESILSEGGRSVGSLADEVDAIDALLQRQRRGELTIDDAVAVFVSERGLTCDARFVESFRTMAVEMVGDFVVPLPGVARTLEALGQRVPIAVLTNGWNPLQAVKARRAGFLGPVLVSSEIGARKPARAAFERLLATLGTPAEQTWYVGDDAYGDVEGAHEAGMQAVWINWERLAYPNGVAPPEHTIVEFGELLELVGEEARAS